MDTGHSHNSGGYELKIDTQVEKFVEIKQKLTYFLITASIAIIVFLANFIDKHTNDVKYLVWLAILSSINGLLTSGCSLLNLHLELRSYRLHLKYRYDRIDWASLSEIQKKEWDVVNRWAARLLTYAFCLLFIEITFAIMFFVLFFYFNQAIVPTK